MGQPEVRVDLRGGERGVAEQLLDRTEIAAPFQHVRRVGVAQRMRAVLAQPTRLEPPLECSSHARRIEPTSTGREQQRGGRVASGEDRPAASQPGCDRVGGALRRGAESIGDG